MESLQPNTGPQATSNDDCFLTTDLFPLIDDSMLKHFDNGEIPLIASNVKVLKINSTLKLLSFIENVNVNDFPYLFVIVLYDNCDESAAATIKGQLEGKFDKRSMAFEIRNTTSEIFIKEKEKKFESDANHVLFLEMLQDKDTEKDELVDDVLASKSDLPFKILKLFDIDIELTFKICENLIKNSKDLLPIFEAMDMDFDSNGPVVSEKSKLLMSHRSSGRSILRQVLELKKENLILFILNNFKKKFECWDFNYKKDLSTIAYKYPEELKEIFPLMIQNNFPYPDKFDEAKFNDCENPVIRDTLELNAAFDGDENQFINIIIDVYTGKLKQTLSSVCYNIHNQSLLKRAFDKNLHLYAFLKARGYSAGHQRETIKHDLKKLSPNLIAEIDKQTLSLALCHDRQHARILASKSKVHDRGNYNAERHQEDSQKIDEIYNVLNSYPMMKDILRIVSEANLLNLEIHFDFTQFYTHEMIVNSERSYGLVYPNGTIIIGAKDFSTAVRTLAHELTHLAMLIVYGNNFVPFNFGDGASDRKYSEVINECYNKYLQEEDERGENYDVSNQIVPVVFLQYSEDLIKVELIVRAPEVIVYYQNDINNEKFRKCMKLYPELFDYFNKKVLVDLANFDVKSLKAIANLNQAFGQLSKNCFELKENVSKIILKGSQIIVTNAPKVAMADIRQRFGNSIDREILFVSAKRLMNSHVFDETLKSLRSSKLKIVINVSKFNEAEVQKILRKLNIQKDHEIFIITKDDLNLNYNKLKVNYSWDDLSPKTKEKLLSRKFNFQGQEIKLSKVLNIYARLWKGEEFLTLILSKENFIINDIKVLENFHLERNFLSKCLIGNPITEEEFKNLREKFGKKIYERQKDDPIGVRYEYEIVRTTHENMQNEGTPSKKRKVDDIERSLEDMKLQSMASTRGRQKVRIENVKEKEIIKKSIGLKYVLISSDAGSGKSHSLKEMQKSLKDSLNLVYFIELNNFINELKSLSDKDAINFKTFFIKNFLASASNFEKILFENFYKNRKIFILFDGFDEISPICKDEVIKLMKSFENRNGSQLWVTSRSHLEQELCQKLDIKSVFSICAFDDKEQVEFLAGYWSKKNDEPFDSLKVQAETFVKRILEGNKDKLDLLRDPQVLTLFADACFINGRVDEDFIKNFTKHLIYQKSIKMHVMKWSSSGSEMVGKANVSCLGFKEIHRYLAVKSFCWDIEDKFDFIRDDDWTDEEIFRCGIVESIIRDQPIFKHESFKEYFVADFILDNLTKRGDYLKEALKLLLQFLGDSEQYHVINMFISGGLKTVDVRKLEDDQIKRIADALNEILTESDYHFLTYAMLQNYQTLYMFLIKVFHKMNPEIKLTQLARELTFDEDIEKIKIHNKFYDTRIKNFNVKMRPLIFDQGFNEDDKNKFEEMLEDFMKNLRQNSPIGRAIGELIKSISSMK